MGQGQSARELHNSSPLRGGGLDELEPGRNVVEKVPHLHCGARRCSHRFNHKVSITADDLIACFLIRRPAVQGQIRYTGDARQSFAAETKGVEGEEIIGSSNFTRGMGLKGQPEIVLGNPRTVVLDADQLQPALSDFNGDLGSRGINGVLHQLLDYRSWPLYDLPGGDFLGYLGRQDPNLSHSFHHPSAGAAFPARQPAFAALPRELRCLGPGRGFPLPRHWGPVPRRRRPQEPRYHSPRP